MRNICDLNIGFNDAEDYKRRENKEFFNSIFVKNENLERLLQPNVFFLLGEKGTGKTAYSVFLANNNYKQTKSAIRYIRETEYNKFISLKKSKNLELSDYKNIWKCILLVLFAADIKERDLDNWFKASKIKEVKRAIEEYYMGAFSPEISTVMSFASESKIAAEAFSKFAKAQVAEGQTSSFTEERFQTNLQFIQQKLQQALSELKLKQNHFIFIDGIDFRPHNISYEDYLDCVKGLANAIWELNNDFFSEIKDSKGRFKVVLLLRPDIFSSIGFQNSSNKIFNNTVFLDWRTDYINFLGSDLMNIPGTMLAKQQGDDSVTAVEAWNHYFSWRAKATSPDREFDPAYIGVLQISLARPRDILTCMKLMQNIMAAKKISGDSFSEEVFHSDEFKNAYSEYFLSNIKDQLSFYYTDDDWELFLQFFSLFSGKTEFTYGEYLIKYAEFVQLIDSKNMGKPEFTDSPEKFLQFLYDANILCYIEYIETKSFFRWCYRERNQTNINPKVKIGASYRIHYALRKRLNMGKVAKDR